MYIHEDINNADYVSLQWEKSRENIDIFLNNLEFLAYLSIKIRR